MTQKSTVTTLQDGDSKTLLFVKAPANSDIDITGLKVTCVPGARFYLLQDGRLYDGPVEDPLGDYGLEPMKPVIVCDTTFEVRMENLSGYEYEAHVSVQYAVRHSNRAHLPSRIKVKPNLALRRRYIRD